jgi:hypothetical protein
VPGQVIDTLTARLRGKREFGLRRQACCGRSAAGGGWNYVWRAQASSHAANTLSAPKALHEPPCLSFLLHHIDLPGLGGGGMSPPTGKPTNGILPMPAGVLQKPNTPTPRGPAAKKPIPPRLKVVLRRLPPGFTEAEFGSLLGEKWKVGGGKVDWFEFKAGKISTE